MPRISIIYDNDGYYYIGRDQKISKAEKARISTEIKSKIDTWLDDDNLLPQAADRLDNQMK